MPKDFATIDLDALDAVTGGRRSSSSSSRSDTDDRIFEALDDIKTALADLGKQKPASNGLDQLLPMLMMQLLNRNNGTGGGYGGGNGCGGGKY